MSNIQDIIKDLDVKQDIKELEHNYWNSSMEGNMDHLKLSYYTYKNYIANCDKYSLYNVPRYKSLIDEHFKQSIIHKIYD